MITAQDNATLARTLYDLWNKRNFDEIASHAIPNVKWINVPMGQTFKGIDGLKLFLRGWASAFPDAKIEVQNIVASEDGVATEFIARGSHGGPLIGPDGTVEATGRRIEMRFCELLRLENGRLAEGHLYFDAATLNRQLGLE